MLNAMNLMGLRPGGLTEEDVQRLRGMQVTGQIPPQQTPTPPPPNLLNPFAVMSHLATNPVPHPAIQRMVAGLLGSDAMSSAERAAYYQATGERISGGGEEQSTPPPAPQAAESGGRTMEYQRQLELTRQHNLQLEEERKAAEEQARLAATRPKRTYYGD